MLGQSLLKHSPSKLMTRAGSKIQGRQIREGDIPKVVDCLTRGFPNRPRQFWLGVLACLKERPAFAGLPKYGYLLEASDIVGVILLIFSSLRSDGADAIRCNVSSWYVQPGFRGYASLLIRMALSHKDVTYLNITPAQNTLPLLEAQGYSRYSAGIFVAGPMFQLRSGNAGVTVARAETYKPAHADPFDRNLLMDHAKYGCISLWCETADSIHPFVFRPCVVKGAIPSARIVYCRDLDDFVRFAGPVGRFLAFRGRPLVLIDSNGPILDLTGKYLDMKMPKYFKGPNRPRLGDLAYTESAMFGI